MNGSKEKHMSLISGLCIQTHICTRKHAFTHMGIHIHSLKVDLPTWLEGTPWLMPLAVNLACSEAGDGRLLCVCTVTGESAWHGAEWFSHDNCKLFSLASSRPLFASDFACKGILGNTRKSPCHYFLARIFKKKSEEEKICIFKTILLKNKQ